MKANERELAASRNREAESRRLEQRESELRDIFNNNNTSDPLYIDPKYIPEGWEYYWARESLRGEPDVGRIIELRKKGWTPVPASRHPHMVFEDFLARKEYLRGYIADRGLVLVERPKSVGDEFRAKLNSLNNRVLKSMPGTEEYDPTFKSSPGITTRSLYRDAVPHQGGFV